MRASLSTDSSSLLAFIHSLNEASHSYHQSRSRINCIQCSQISPFIFFFYFVGMNKSRRGWLMTMKMMVVCFMFSEWAEYFDSNSLSFFIIAIPRNS